MIWIPSHDLPTKNPIAWNILPIQILIAVEFKVYPFFKLSNVQFPSNDERFSQQVSCPYGRVKSILLEFENN